MNKKFRLPVLALSSAVAFSGAIAVPVAAPAVFANVAFAQETAKEFPAKFLVGSAEEAKPFAPAYHSYDEIVRARELMFEAAKKAQFYRSDVPFSWTGRALAENAYYIAQARLAIVVLQAANFEGARQLDPQLVGIEDATTVEAEKVVNAAFAHYNGTGANEKAVHNLVNAGRTGINAFKSKNNYRETNAFAVIDWGTTEQEKIQANGSYQALLTNIDVVTVPFDAAQPTKHLDLEVEKTKAAKTKENLVAANGPLEPVLENYADVAKPVNDVAAEAKSITDQADAIAKRINAKAEEIKALREKIAAVEAAMTTANESKDIAAAKAQKTPADEALAQAKQLKQELDTLQAQHTAEEEKKKQEEANKQQEEAKKQQEAEAKKALEAKKQQVEAKKKEAETLAAAALAKVEGNTSAEAEAYKKKVEALKAKIAEEAAKLPNASTVEALTPIEEALSTLVAEAKKLGGEAPEKKDESTPQDKKGLSPAAIAGIVVGAIALVAAVIAAAFPTLAKFVPGLARFNPAGR
ncbi:hypothetical protein P4N68_08410 [Corynebacterium felinum]|uniref:Chemotaxis protein histidine kinase CheA n=1 Tax=Corynebacterium felinum TaxID=131318 RepID=A0ABU2B9A7_9CORY|nr:hypothetical protein [Corynebacterium felinum]MDF5821099.1 hypothetical protein [Corynebacterium felinum]MDR7354966.1 chemotaxis protein histidine kinase CheA [Corynebacterium felinum]WJY94322.1 Chromosome partition protein Smc [Corynebacterium felinum]